MRPPPFPPESLVMLSAIPVLILKDEPWGAARPQRSEGCKGEGVASARTVSEARQLSKTLTFDVAVLDLHLSDGDVTPALDTLHARRAPTVAYNSTELPAKMWQRHPDLVALRNPALSGRIVADIPRARRRGT